jgi:hypothetical protein
MKRFLILAMLALLALGIQAEGAVFSGNVDVGLKADLSSDASTIYGFSDNAGFPLQINTRVDYALDQNAGLTVNFRTRGTGQSIGTSGRGIPYLNRGLVWAKFMDGAVKVRAGYLWDTDYESSWNAWDTGTVLEWCTSVDFFPTKELQIGFVVPAPTGAIPADVAIKNTTVGINWTPSFGRVSVMAEYGATDADRSLNFGVDLNIVKGATIRLEGDLQQIGIDKAGYYQLFQQAGYSFGPVYAEMQITEVISKIDAPLKVNLLPNVATKIGDFSLYGQFAYNVIGDDMAGAFKQVKVSAKKALNAKSWVAVGSYLTMGDIPKVSPYINLFAGY